MNKGVSNFKLSNAQIGFLLVLPGLAIFIGIIIYPFVSAILMSFTNKSLLYSEHRFLGIENYIKVFNDPYFLNTVMTTLIFVVCATILPFTLGLIWAIVLNEKFKCSELLRGITLINWIIPGTAIGFLWSWIFNGQYGILNGVLMKIGIIDSGISWMGQTSTALMCVVIARTWQMLPWYMAFLLGGLGGVSMEEVEAAKIDGAGNWTVFKHIVLPTIKPIALIVLVLGTIGNLQHFDLPWTMVQGGPARATTTLSIEVYKTAFKNWDMGRAATIGTVWAILLAVFSVIYLKQVKEAD